MQIFFLEGNRTVLWLRIELSNHRRADEAARRRQRTSKLRHFELIRQANGQFGVSIVFRVVSNWSVGHKGFVGEKRPAPLWIQPLSNCQCGDVHWWFEPHRGARSIMGTATTRPSGSRYFPPFFAPPCDYETIESRPAQWAGKWLPQRIKLPLAAERTDGDSVCAERERLSNTVENPQRTPFDFGIFPFQLQHSVWICGFWS